MIETITLLGLGALGSKVYNAYKKNYKKEIIPDLPVEEELLEVIKICSEIGSIEKYERQKFVRLCDLCRKHKNDDNVKIEVKVLVGKLVKEINEVKLDFYIEEVYDRLKGLPELERRIEVLRDSVEYNKAYNYLSNSNFNDISDKEYSELLELGWYEKKKLIVRTLGRVFDWDYKKFDSLYTEDLSEWIIELDSV